MQTRRDFVKTSAAAVGALALPVRALAEEKPSRIPIAFSTLGCPAWDFPKILTFAHDHGFSAVELRGLQGNMDLPSSPVFAPDRIEQTKKEIKDHNLRIASVSSSATMYFEDPARRAKELADARRFIDLASSLNAPYVRVFGGKADTDNSPAPDDATK